MRKLVFSTSINSELLQTHTHTHTHTHTGKHKFMAKVILPQGFWLKAGWVGFWISKPGGREDKNGMNWWSLLSTQTFISRLFSSHLFSFLFLQSLLLSSSLILSSLGQPKKKAHRFCGSCPSCLLGGDSFIQSSSYLLLCVSYSTRNARQVEIRSPDLSYETSGLLALHYPCHPCQGDNSTQKKHLNW